MWAKPYKRFPGASFSWDGFNMERTYICADPFARFGTPEDGWFVQNTPCKKNQPGAVCDPDYTTGAKPYTRFPDASLNPVGFNIERKHMTPYSSLRTSRRWLIRSEEIILRACCLFVFLGSKLEDCWFVQKKSDAKQYTRFPGASLKPSGFNMKRTNKTSQTWLWSSRRRLIRPE